LLNGAMLALLIETALGILPRFLISIPLLYVAGYLGLAVVSQREADEFTHRAKQASLAAEALPRLPAQPLQIITAEFHSAVDRLSLLNPQIFSVQEGVPRQTLFASRETCDALKTQREQALTALQGEFGIEAYTAKRILVLDFERLPYHFNKQPFAQSYCALVRAASAPAGLAQLEIMRLDNHQFKVLSGFVTHRRLTAPDGSVREIYTGILKVLGYIPLPTLGCGLISSGVPSWNCSFSFMPTSVKLSAGKADTLESWFQTPSEPRPAPEGLYQLSMFTADLEGARLRLREALHNRLVERLSPGTVKVKGLARGHNFWSSDEKHLTTLQAHPEHLAAAVPALLNAYRSDDPATRRLAQSVLALAPLTDPAERQQLASLVHADLCEAALPRRAPVSEQTLKLQQRVSAEVAAIDAANLNRLLARPIADAPPCLIKPVMTSDQAATLVQIWRAQLDLALGGSKRDRWSYQKLSVLRNEPFLGRLGNILAELPEAEFAAIKPDLFDLLSQYIPEFDREQPFPAAPSFYIAKLSPALVSRLQPDLVAAELARLREVATQDPVSGNSLAFKNWTGSYFITPAVLATPDALLGQGQMLLAGLVRLQKFDDSLTVTTAGEYRISIWIARYMLSTALAALPETEFNNLLPAFLQAAQEHRQLAFRLEERASVLTKRLLKSAIGPEWRQLMR